MKTIHLPFFWEGLLWTLLFFGAQFTLNSRKKCRTPLEHRLTNQYESARRLFFVHESAWVALFATNTIACCLPHSMMVTYGGILGFLLCTMGYIDVFCLKIPDELLWLTLFFGYFLREIASI